MEDSIKNEKKALTALAAVIKKDLTAAIRKRDNELKVYEKTLKTAIKQDLSPDLIVYDYAIWVVL